MIFSKACEYGLRSALYVATRDSDEYVPIREIASNLGISHHFLTKVLQELTRARIMRSLRGPNGGVALNSDVDCISLYDIISAIDGRDHFDNCVLGLPSCDDIHPCPLHSYWGAVRDDIKTEFQNISLRALSRRIEVEGLRISSQIDARTGVKG